ncbi:hypothetical protein CWI37_0248p0030 [Hamiltosporidium tvaerminnensis]|uniref:Uncharacterized protein n=2 Tax=Hamiltosporidium TaxID=1176354 RepID=A0A4V6MVF3_9MICR|nr:hypothetical protein LUQ84_000617 [Hamiltosporidium tvaerminnensis]TBU03701.1 hypothetical protein CWI37_0248p0030 [Hamiltosporidium tvaerminnensis]TBU05382.1 hypothetical protein CWI36_0642p0010 [Hamiltosporidium magnivora]
MIYFVILCLISCEIDNAKEYIIEIADEPQTVLSLINGKLRFREIDNLPDMYKNKAEIVQFLGSADTYEIKLGEYVICKDKQSFRIGLCTHYNPNTYFSIKGSGMGFTFGLESDKFCIIRGERDDEDKYEGYHVDLDYCEKQLEHKTFNITEFIQQKSFELNPGYKRDIDKETMAEYYFKV